MLFRSKKQNLALNPAKISGVCGRLMCCLYYEYDDNRELAEHDDDLTPAEKKGKNCADCPKNAKKARRQMEEDDNLGSEE